MGSSFKSTKSSSSSNNSKGKGTYDELNPCGCGFPSRIWTSYTPGNPGRKFRVCPNSLDETKKKCEFWEWVDDDEEPGNKNKKDVGGIRSLILKISKMEEEFSDYNMKTDKEAKMIRKEL